MILFNFYLLKLLIFNFILVNLVLSSFIDVELEDGIIRGQEAIDRKGQLFYSFRGIPFAKPPIGNLRFQPPQPNEPWDGIKEALEYPVNCPQMVWDPRLHDVFDEDCLYLNVFVPSVKNGDNELKPVMFYIFGGGFISGTCSSSQQGPENMVAEDIILVTANYRLGLYGFLKMNDPSLNIFGNMGFKDQVAVMRWIQRNISRFGGDPNRVTLVGNSSGSFCVHAHMLSPLSKGLFHQVIMESGTALSMNVTIDVFNIARRINRNLEFKLENENDALQIFNHFNSTMTTELIFKVLIKDDSQYDIFGLVIEDPESPEPFINESINERILKNEYVSDVPMIIGYTNEEGIQFFERYSKPKEEWLIVSEQRLAGLILNKNKFDSEREKKYFEKILIDAYLSNTKYSDVYNFFHLNQDLRFLIPIYEVVKSRLIYSKKSTFLYRFTFDTKINYLKNRENFNFSGAAHGDELGYIFRQDYLYPDNIESGSLEDLGITYMTTLWSNFMKTGNPNYPKLLGVKWSPVKNCMPYNLEIGPKLKLRSCFYENDRIQFWEKLWSKYSPNRFFSSCKYNNWNYLKNVFCWTLY